MERPENAVHNVSLFGKLVGCFVPTKDTFEAGKDTTVFKRRCLRLIHRYLTSELPPRIYAFEKDPIQYSGTHPELSGTSECSVDLLKVTESLRGSLSESDRKKMDESIMSLTQNKQHLRQWRIPAVLRMLSLLQNTKSSSVIASPSPGANPLQEHARGNRNSRVLESLVSNAVLDDTNKKSNKQTAAFPYVPRRIGTAERLIKAKLWRIEARLVRDILYVFQNIDGHLIRFNIEKDRYVLSPKLEISAAMRRIVYKLCELGWLYRKVQTFISSTVSAPELGLVAQTFASVFQDELQEYFRLIAVLETQCYSYELSDDEADLSDSETNRNSERYLSSNLTLRQLAVWAREPTRKMQLMAEISDSVVGLAAGALVSVLHTYSAHGDPFVNSFAESILQRVSRPIFHSIRLWTIHGEIDDVCADFFVATTPGVDVRDIWFDKYKLRSSMIPSFIGKDLARRILLVGKSINFMRSCCGIVLSEDNEIESDRDPNGLESGLGITANERAQLAEAEEILESDKLLYSAKAIVDMNFDDIRTDGLQSDGYPAIGTSNSVSLVLAIDWAARITNNLLLRNLFGRFQLLTHCRALKQYMLLGQGDTIQYLMDLLGPTLDQPAQSIHRHTVASQLHTAIRASNARLDSDDVLDRLDVRLLESSPGDFGWDIFVLDYHLGMPLEAVITKTAMARYHEMFQFLWNIKRTEHSLNAAFKREMNAEHVVRDFSILRPVLLRFQILRNEMVHYITNLHNYIMFEVLESSWHELEKELNNAADLDQVIRAHDKYLKNIQRKALVSGDSCSRIESDTNPSHSPLLVPSTVVEAQKGFNNSYATQSHSGEEPLLDCMQRLFSHILHFCGMQKRLYNRVNTLVQRVSIANRAIAARATRKEWGIRSAHDAVASPSNPYETNSSDPDVIARNGQESIKEDIAEKVVVLSKRYREELQAFLKRLQPMGSENLKFLRFRLDFNLFYQTATSVSA